MQVREETPVARHKLVKVGEVQKMTGLTRFEIFTTQGFPKPYKRGPMVLGWNPEEVRRWVAERG